MRGSSGLLRTARRARSESQASAQESRMRTRFLAILLIPAALAVSGCSDDDPAGPRREPIAFQTLHASQFSGIGTRRGEIVRDQARWSAVWQEIHGSVTPQPPLPAVDFLAEMVILAAAGQRGDSCWDVSIRSVESGGGEVAVRADEIRRTGCGCAAVIVHPVHVVRAARADGPGQFAFESRDTPVCQ
jgi:hypothetical protein